MNSVILDPADPDQSYRGLNLSWSVLLYSTVHEDEIISSVSKIIF
jgi:hypothetical protein